jgi:hypothetical protein
MPDYYFIDILSHPNLPLIYISAWQDFAKSLTTTKILVVNVMDGSILDQMPLQLSNPPNNAAIYPYLLPNYNKSVFYFPMSDTMPTTGFNDVATVDMSSGKAFHIKNAFSSKLYKATIFFASGTADDSIFFVDYLNITSVNTQTFDIDLWVDLSQGWVTL